MVKSIFYKCCNTNLGRTLISGRIFIIILQLISITLFLDKEILADMIDFIRQTQIKSFPD